VVLSPHPRFTRQGNDLLYIDRISLVQALTGFEHTIDHLDGHKVTIKRKGVTKPGDIMRLTGEGMPIQGSSKKGALTIEFDVEFPTQLTAEQKAGFARLL